MDHDLRDTEYPPRAELPYLAAVGANRWRAVCKAHSFRGGVTTSKSDALDELSAHMELRHPKDAA